ncbi:uncharacterized protein LOC115241468 [Formica exsecta]|uniref:uncharacterized protein LOC115241468 n=1 Tax=Formica exsecta TaxID=72781 RepID=UPI0011431D69|nr:uncharacterized protein LOC115241468 [Formica exsecta]
MATIKQLPYDVIAHILGNKSINSEDLMRFGSTCKSQLLSDLTREYNFKLIFYCLKQYRFIHKQIKFMKMSETKLLLEKQLTIAAQYFQPHVSYSVVKLWLDNIVQTVLSRLKNKYPAHSICSTTLEQFSFWRDNNIDDNFWNETESKQIMCILEEYIFSELEIHKLHQLLMSSDLEAKYIKYVTRRLGICNVLNVTYKEDIVVIWKPEYNTNNWDNAEYFHINQNSKLLYPSNIVKRRYQNNELILAEPSSDIELTQEIMRNFYRKLMYNNYDCEWNFNVFFNFLNQCYDEDIGNIDIETEYENITNIIEIRSNAVVNKPLKRRPTKFKFAVGMIVTHTWFGHFCDNHDGVIVGWHHECERMFKDKLEKTIMFPYLRQFSRHYHFCMCKKFSKSARQPHYIILTENNTICYGRQDQLSIRPPRKIKNIEIGRYFSRFEGTYYVPNESLRKRYPKDTATIAKILAKQ